MANGRQIGVRAAESAEFQRLQERLGATLERGGSTVVVVPSLTLHPDELRKIAGATHFEQRMLYQLQELCQPDARLVYVTSQQIDPVTVDYAIGLVSYLPKPDARRRLTLLDCADSSSDPLTAKILLRPDLVEAIKASIADIDNAYLVTFTSTPLERDLALRLGIPMFCCDPALASLGSKSASRQLLREARVPVPEGFEDLRDEDDIVDALARLKSANPNLDKAVVKLNDSFAGIGNALFSFADAPPTDDVAPWIAGALPHRIEFTCRGDDWDSFVKRFRSSGGVVESYVDALGKRSPSAQLEISPRGDVRMISTHDQVIGGSVGQTFVGCSFPARKAYRLRIQELAMRAGRLLASKGVIGQLSVDFLVDPGRPGWRVHALEVNLRLGGTTAPYMFLHGLVAGRYARESGDYLSPAGRPMHYVASDRIRREEFVSLTPRDVVEIAGREGLHYNEKTGIGTIFYSLGALTDYGKLGMVAIAESPENAARIYDLTIATLAAEGARRQISDLEAVAGGPYR